MVKNTLRIEILAYVSEPDKNYNYDGDVVEFRGKRYWVSLAEERVEFLGEIDRKRWDRLIVMGEIVERKNVKKGGG